MIPTWRDSPCRKHLFWTSPTLPNPYIVSAQLSERVGDIDAALKSLKIAWTLEPDNEKVGTMIRNLGEVPGPTMLGSIEMGG